MTAHLLIEIDVHDPARYRDYVRQARPLVERFGGEYLIRGGERITPLAGGWTPARLLLLRFPSRQALDACFASPDYQAIAPLRLTSTRSRAVIIEDSPPVAF